MVVEQAMMVDVTRRLYVGHISHTVTNDELSDIVEEDGVVEKVEVFCPLIYLLFKFSLF